MSTIRLNFTVCECCCHSELMRALREVLIWPEREDVQRMLRRVVARGEVSPGNPALDYVMHMMVGAFIPAI